MASTNRVRELRVGRGLSQAALAHEVSLSRQSLSAIEAGRALPGVDVALRLARALDSSVEQLFGSAERLCAEPAGRASGGRVALAEVAGRWVAHALERGSVCAAASGIAGPRRRGAPLEIELVEPVERARENLLLMGCAPALGLLADRLAAQRASGRFVWLPCSSTAALEALERRQTHVAGVHLVDGRTGEPNVADVRRLVVSEAVTLVTLARWEQGLLVRREDARRIQRAEQLARRGLRVVTREQGSGARRLLDRVLRDAGASRASRGALQAEGHLEVAHAIAIGAADTGVATRDAAIAYRLGFLPLSEERYDLAIPTPSLGDPRIARLLDALSDLAVRRELSSLGYDVTSAGARVAA